MHEVSKLSLVSRIRPGGGGLTERMFLDFVIDGHSLYETLTVRGHDLVTPLGWGDAAVQRAALLRLRLEREPSLKGGREPLMVCPECGEPACGAVTARIGASRGIAEWSLLAWETDHQESSPDNEGYEDLGPYCFELRDYRAALRVEHLDRC